MRRLSLIALTLAAAVALTGCAAGKPDRAATEKGLTRVLEAQAKTPEQKAASGGVASCTLDRVWDKADPKTLQAWSEGKSDTEVVADNIVVLEAVRACDEKALAALNAADKEAAGPMPSSTAIRDGLASTFLSQPAAPSQEQATRIADCVIERVGDRVSETTQRAWAEGRGEMTVDDSTAVNDAIRTCAEQVQ